MVGGVPSQSPPTSAPLLGVHGMAIGILVPGNSVLHIRSRGRYISGMSVERSKRPRAHRLLVRHCYFTHLWQISGGAGVRWPMGVGV